MDALPLEERLQVWDETERNFWAGIRNDWDKTQTEAEKTHQQTVVDLKVDMGTLIGRQSQLTETRGRLAKELAQLEQELSRMADRCDEKANQLHELEKTYREEQQKRLEMRERVTQKMTAYFQKMRTGSNSQAGDSSPDTDEPRHRAPEPAEPMDVEEIPSRTNLHPESQHALVDVIHADGRIVGPVMSIDPWNQWVKSILELPIRRPVKIRRGRKFNQDHLATIYERTEAKGVKWLSCMIQAIGEVQSQRCVSCDKNQGAFDDCIIIGGDMFNKCGNCEWNRQGCHGASGEHIDFHELDVQSNAAPQEHAPRQQVEEKTEAENSRPSVVNGESSPKPHVTPEKKPEVANPPKETPEAGQTNNADKMNLAYRAAREAEDLMTRKAQEDELRYRKAQAVQKAFEKASGLARARSPVTNIQPSTERESSASRSNERVSPQTSDHRPPSSGNRDHLASGFTPANARSRHPSQEVPLSTAASTSPQPNPSWVYIPSEEITKENLILRDNGTVFTYPDCVEGVPLVKINERHPYWDKTWPDVKSLIEPALETWREKYQVAVEDEARGEKRGTSKYQIGRQVNRGIKILEFLENGEISPYQLLAKRYLHSGKGGITSYDTLFRLTDTLSELSKFKLDIKPVDWLRQRLHELIIEHGADFNFPRIIHDFYHDPKLTYLRMKHGFKNIGRPSSVRTSRYSLGSTNGTPRHQPLKRKVLHSQAGTPRDTPVSERSPLIGQMSLPPESPPSALGPKRFKPLSPNQPPAKNEQQAGDLSDADSWCGSPLTFHDWRLYQVKTRLYTSSTRVTQYWTWLEDRKRFEHQVLTEVDPPRWGVLKEPINFDLRLDEMVGISWNLTALRIMITVNAERPNVAKKDGRPRGDIMAAFKRERTMRRFLAFCRLKKIPVLEVSVDDIERKWQEMHSEQLPDRDEDASEELRG